MPQLNLDPKADPRSIVQAGAARFTVLTPQLIRLEFDETRGFEDRASMVVINRRLPPPAFGARSHDGWLIIETEALRLRYRVGAGAFNAANLAIELNVNGQQVKWRPGEAASHSRALAKLPRRRSREAVPGDQAMGGRGSRQSSVRRGVKGRPFASTKSIGAYVE